MVTGKDSPEITEANEVEAAQVRLPELTVIGPPGETVKVTGGVSILQLLNKSAESEKIANLTVRLKPNFLNIDLPSPNFSGHGDARVRPCNEKPM